MPLIKRRLPLELLAVVGLQVLLLWPLLTTPYMGDDGLNASFSGGMATTHQSFTELTWNVAEGWIVQQGRWFPASFYLGYGQFALVHSMVGYKLLLLLWVVLSTVCVMALVRRLGGGPAVAALVAIGATLTVQFRFYNDPVISYTGLMQSVLAMMALSALLFDVWLRDRRWWALVLSLVLIVLAASTYESAPLLCGMHLVVAIAERHNLRRGMLASLPALATGAAMLVLSLVLRARATAPSPAYEANADLSVFIPAFGKQLLGTLPLSYAAFNPGSVFLFRGDAFVKSMGPASIIAGVLVALVVFWLVREAWNWSFTAPWTPWLAMGLGIVLILAPAAPIALARRYQAELVPGISYLPVYLQGFGLALVAAGLLGLLRRSLRRTGAVMVVASVVLALGAGSVAAVTHRANTLVRDGMQPTRDVQLNLRHAVEAGLFADASSPRTLVTLDAAPYWLTPEFVATYRPVLFPAGARVPDPGAIDTKDAAGDWYVQPGQFEAWAGPIAGGAPAKLFLAKGSGHTRVALLGGERPGALVHPDPEADRMVTLPRGVLAHDVAVVPVADESAPTLYGFAGCSGPDPGSLNVPCGRLGAVAVVNPTGEPLRVDVRATVSTSGPRPAAVQLSWPDGTRSLRVGLTAKPVSMSLNLPARGATVIRVQTSARPVPATLDPRRWSVVLGGASVTAD
ncbi:MAG: hypothetical protein ACSLFR_09490 [Solirubrobacteraceae bacterium]